MVNDSVSTILGFDFGMKRIGVAVLSSLVGKAQPLNLLEAQDGVPAWPAVKTLIEQWLVDIMVVGLPYTLSGQSQRMTHAARKFANKLHGRFGLPVYLVDEVLTTKAAKQALSSLDDKQTCSVDSYAAKLIVESWWHEQPRQQKTP